MTIEFVFPENYPSDACADFVIKCDWLTEEQLNLISRKFHLTWQESGGCVVLFSWITLIKEDLLNLLGIYSELKIIPTIISIPENQTKTVDIDANNDHDSKEYEGTICKFYQVRGFGFIKCHKLKPTEIFFHISEFKNRGDITNEEDILHKDVIFEKSFNKFRKKVMAINVKLLKDDDEKTKNVTGNDEEEQEVMELEEPKLVKLMKSYQEEQELKIFNMQFFDCSICFVEKPGKSCLKFVQCNHGAKHLRPCYNITCNALPQYL